MAFNPENCALLERLEQAIAAMATPTREVFLMHRLESLGYAEIGERLGLSVADVERHIAAAMLHLVHALDDRDGEG